MFYIDNFFRNTKIQTFFSKYLALYAEIELPRKHVITREADELNYIYLIKEGEIELIINVNYEQLQEKIQVLSKKVNYNWKIVSNSRKPTA